MQPPPLSLARADWQQAMCDVAHSRFTAHWSEFEPDSQLREQAEALAQSKYSQAAYNQKR
jgi:hypothetical protein